MEPFFVRIYADIGGAISAIGWLFARPSPWREFVFLVIDAAVIFVAIQLLRGAWRKNDFLSPLERLVFLSLPVLLIFMGLWVMEEEHPEVMIEAVTAVIGLLTMLLVARQITLAQRLEQIASTQTKILEHQDTIMSALAHLQVWGTVEFQQPFSAEKLRTNVGFGVVNTGSRSAQWATLQLLVPPEFNADAMKNLPEFPLWYRTPDDAGYSRWETDLDRFFFVDAPVNRVTFVSFFHPIGSREVFERIRWRIAFADGIVPGRGQWAQLTPTPPQASAT